MPRSGLGGAQGRSQARCPRGCAARSRRLPGDRSRGSRGERDPLSHRERRPRSGDAAGGDPQAAHRGGEGDARAVDRRGRRVRAALVVPCAARDRAAADRRRFEPDRRVRRGGASRGGLRAFARSRSRDAPSPRVARPDRAAAVACGTRRLRTRRRADGFRSRLRGRGRSPLGEPALRRALGPRVARCGALRRHARAASGQRAGDVALPRLGRRGAQRQQALRRVLDRADRGRPSARGLARPAGRERLRALPRDDLRRRFDQRGVPRQVRGRPHRDLRDDLARHDRRLRRVPRSQVRPALAGGVLRPLRVLQFDRRGGDGRQREGAAAGHQGALAAREGGARPARHSDRDPSHTARRRASRCRDARDRLERSAARGAGRTLAPARARVGRRAKRRRLLRSRRRHHARAVDRGRDRRVRVDRDAAGGSRRAALGDPPRCDRARVDAEVGTGRRHRQRQLRAQRDRLRDRAARGRSRRRRGLRARVDRRGDRDV